MVLQVDNQSKMKHVCRHENFQDFTWFHIFCTGRIPEIGWNPDLFSWNSLNFTSLVQFKIILILPPLISVCVMPSLSDVIWVILAVEEHGLLGVTQQMSQCGGDLGGPLAQSQPQQDNPFGSPQRTPNTSFGSPCSYPGSPFGVTGSPSLSVVGQAGSLPCSPSTMNSSFSSSPAAHVRTALFQVRGTFH